MLEWLYMLMVKLSVLVAVGCWTTVAAAAFIAAEKKFR